MKYNIKFSLLIACTIFMSSHCIGQININKISNKVKSQIPKQNKEGSNALSNDQVVKGLKEALNVGVNKGSEQASAVGGFLKNDLIRIPFPPEAKAVRDKAMQWGLDTKVEKFEKTLNEVDLDVVLRDALETMSMRDAVDAVSQAHGKPRRQVYQLALNIGKDD